MKRRARYAGLVVLVVAGAARAQYPGHVAGGKQDAAPVARATAVLEWTGDISSPTASRLVPIAVFDGQNYQPGGLYLAQPAPLAVQSGTVYQLEQAGTPKAEFDVDGARNVQGSWLGFGKWKALTAAKVPKLQTSKVMPQGVRDVDPDKPTLHRAPGSEGDASAGGGSASKSADTEAKTTDPDRPTLHKRSADSGSAAQKPDAGNVPATSVPAANNTAPDVDPDRPTLHKHSGAANKSASDTAAGGAPVSATTETDPDRPKLAYGRPAVSGKMLEPVKLEGLPKDLEQMAAVSDAKTREPHDFIYKWGSPEDGTKMQNAMEDLAKKALAATQGKPATVPVTAQPKATKPMTPAQRRLAAKRKAAAEAEAPALPELANEKFEAYELSYSGGSTLVLTAESTDEGDARKYVTVIAQPDFYGAVKVLLQQVTSEATLDVTPRMRLVDAVDTDGDNRAELVFELRGKTDRQFAIYRVAGGRAEQVFTTGSLP